MEIPAVPGGSDQLREVARRGSARHGHRPESLTRARGRSGRERSQFERRFASEIVATTTGTVPGRRRDRGGEAVWVERELARRTQPGKGRQDESSQMG